MPEGADENANREARSGARSPSAISPAKQHFELGEALGAMDFEAAAKLSGARFVVLQGALARLHRALAEFMLDIHTEEIGYTEVMPPYLVRDHVLYGTGQLPKFAEDQFRTTDDFWLIPTAEVPLTNLAAGEIYDEAQLPLRVTALHALLPVRGRGRRQGHPRHAAPASVREGRAGLDRPSRPLGRGARAHDACAEAVLQRLGLHYRKVVLCTGDMGFGARKTYDIEVWLPGQERLPRDLELLQLRRLPGAAHEGPLPAGGEKGTRFVHTSTARAWRSADA